MYLYYIHICIINLHLHCIYVLIVQYVYLVYKLPSLINIFVYHKIINIHTKSNKKFQSNTYYFEKDFASKIT